RSLTYSVTSGFTYALDDRQGLGLELALGNRSSLLVFTETGEVDYTAGTPFTERLDDYSGWGARLELGLGRKAEVQLGVEDTEFDSNLPGFDRSVTRITTQIRLSHTSWP
ncbi:MAG: hypothetical protein KDD47_04170, partial [Acidobacteria bacterium]|nr:hypothetical protein [Acidobacteriota bacterium]